MSKINRYIAVLLSVYFLGLMFMPCNDTCNSHEHDSVVTFQTMQDHHEADNDICSPFCFCSCCSTAMTALHFSVFTIIPNVDLNNYSTFYESFHSIEYSSIWQPPKLS